MRMVDARMGWLSLELRHWEGPFSMLVKIEWICHKEWQTP